MNNQRSFSPSALARLAGLAIVLAVCLITTTAFASTPQGTFERTLQVSGPVDLEVATHSGDITVRSGAAGSVVIRAKIFVGDHWLMGDRKADVAEIEQHPPVRQEGNSIHIDYVNAHDISVDYEITVPADTALRAHSGSGDQIIEGLHGNADLGSGSGDLKLTRLTGEIHVQTGSGNVRAHGISGAVRGGTGSGDVEVEETGAGDIDLHTGSGNVTARGVREHSVRKQAAATLPPRARRAGHGTFAPAPAMCMCGCRATPRSTPKSQPVQVRWISTRP